MCVKSVGFGIGGCYSHVVSNSFLHSLENIGTKSEMPEVRIISYSSQMTSAILYSTSRVNHSHSVTHSDGENNVV